MRSYGGRCPLGSNGVQTGSRQVWLEDAPLPTSEPLALTHKQVVEVPGPERGPMHGRS